MPLTSGVISQFANQHKGQKQLNRLMHVAYMFGSVNARVQPHGRTVWTKKTEMIYEDENKNSARAYCVQGHWTRNWTPVGH